MTCRTQGQGSRRQACGMGSGRRRRSLFQRKKVGGGCGGRPSGLTAERLITFSSSAAPGLLPGRLPRAVLAGGASCVNKTEILANRVAFGCCLGKTRKFYDVCLLDAAVYADVPLI